MLEFYKTTGGRRFIDSTMPEIGKQLRRIADALEAQAVADAHASEVLDLMERGIRPVRLDVPVGETFNYVGDTLKVVYPRTDTRCAECYFRHAAGCSHLPVCTADDRADGTAVMFVLAEPASDTTPPNSTTK